ncbi:MAG TPA: TetR/AcrR family transcriptional regulator [Ktedonobacteraceae bacterium]|nr:TetR/AcrR family transcriptional regulator [Ktedonobacteraceae bacterium]
MKEESGQFSCPAGMPEWFIAHHRHERRDAAEHRQRILEVAQRLFAERGVDAVSMHQIAKAVGIGQGTLYRRYRHKGELCVDLMREHHERFMEEIAALFAQTEAAPALEILGGVLIKMVALLEEQATFLGPIGGTMTRDAQCNEADNSRHFFFQQSPWYLWLHELLAGLLTEAVERGELAALDVPFTVDTMLAVLNPPFYRFQRLERGFSQERILQGLRRIYIEGVKTPYPPMALLTTTGEIAG